MGNGSGEWLKRRRLRGTLEVVGSVITVHRDLDVQAIFLRDPTGLTVTPLRASVDRDWFYTWGYGVDWSNNPTKHLTRSDFSLPQLCPSDAHADAGTLCWQTTATNSLCDGDSGAPVTQNGAIIGMFTVTANSGAPDDCSTVERGQALTVEDMQPWLDLMIQDAIPFPRSPSRDPLPAIPFPRSPSREPLPVSPFP